MSRDPVTRILFGALALVVLAGCGATARAQPPEAPGQQVVWERCDTPDRQGATIALMELVAEDEGLKRSLEESIALGQRINSDPRTNPVASLADYFDFIDALTTYDPRNIDTGRHRGRVRISMDGKNYCNWNILDILSYSYFLVDRQITTDPRGQIQFANAKFSRWMRQVAEEWGKYLETKDSAKYVPSFKDDDFFGDWYCDKHYPTFQKFFTRELCKKDYPNCSREVEGLGKPLTVVSVADSNTLGSWPISDDGKLVTSYDGIAQSGQLIKGQLYSDIHEFVAGGEGETTIGRSFGDLDPARFDGGTFTHQFLNVNNYHRLHVPVAGKVVYLRHFKSATRMKSGWKPPLGPTDVGYYDPRDTPDWQFGQTRLVLGIETPGHGVVIAAPMGMAQVSSIRLRDWVELGAMAEKGWEFGNFAFGGSDFVVIFEKKAGFVLTVPKMAEEAPGAGVNYKPSLQGEKYGCFGGDPGCPKTPKKFPDKYPGCHAGHGAG